MLSKILLFLSYFLNKTLIYICRHMYNINNKNATEERELIFIKDIYFLYSDKKLITFTDKFFFIIFDIISHLLARYLIKFE